MKTFSALLAICAGNSPVPGEFPAQRPVTRSFDVLFDLRLNKRSVNNREAGDLRRYGALYDVIVMISLLIYAISCYSIMALSCSLWTCYMHNYLPMAILLLSHKLHSDDNSLTNLLWVCPKVGKCISPLMKSVSMLTSIEWRAMLGCAWPGAEVRSSSMREAWQMIGFST